MKKEEKIIYCADAICLLEGKIVLVERLGSVKGLALPGGKQDPGESLTATIIREFKEETGLEFVPDIVFGTYAEPERDPRGKYVSTVFVGKAMWETSGSIRNEPGKTRVILLDPKEFSARRNEFAFDHGDILAWFLESR